MFAQPVTKMRSFIDFLNEKSVSSKITNEEGTVLAVPLNFESAPNSELFLFFGEYDVQMVIPDIISNVPVIKETSFYELINRFNIERKYVKFCYTESRGINIGVDYVLSNTEIDNETLFSLIIMMMNTVDDYYPMLMKLMWS